MTVFSRYLQVDFANITKQFGAKKVLDDVSGTFQGGKTTVILGGSGTGKSVLIKTICGILQQDAGSILIDGKDISALPRSELAKIYDQIGFVFQHGALFDSLPVWQNVCFKLMQNQKFTKMALIDKAAQTLQMVGLSPDILKLSTYKLSGGMQKRVAIARAIAYEPKIIFFDEPTTGLDPVMSEIINHLITQCSNVLNSTNIVVTHDMNGAKKLGDIVLFLYQGKVIWQGSGSSLFSSNNEYVDQFVYGKVDGPIVFN